MELKQKARAWKIAQHKRISAKIASHNQNHNCMVCEYGFEENWVSEEAAAFAAHCVAEEREACRRIMAENSGLSVLQIAQLIRARKDS